MSISGEQDGQPMEAGLPISDVMAGMYACVAIFAELRQHDATGHGQRIDVSLLDCQLAWLHNQVSNYLVSRQVPERIGKAHPDIVPHQTFATPTATSTLVGNDTRFLQFCGLLGVEALGRTCGSAPRRFGCKTAMCSLPKGARAWAGSQR